MSKSSPPLLLLAALFAAGCSSSSTGDAPADSAVTADTRAGDDAAATDTASGSDTATAIDSSAADVAVDVVPINEPLFELTLDGKSVTPTTVTTEKVGTFSDTDPSVKGLARFKAVLPRGATDESDPYINFEIYTPKLGELPYGPVTSTSQPGSIYLQYHYARPGVSGFPKAQGPGMNIVRDGRDGWLEVTGSGTFNIDHVDVSFTLKVREPIPKTS